MSKVGGRGARTGQPGRRPGKMRLGRRLKESHVRRRSGTRKHPSDLTSTHDSSSSSSAFLLPHAQSRPQEFPAHSRAVCSPGAYQARYVAHPTYSDKLILQNSERWPRRYCCYSPLLCNGEGWCVSHTILRSTCLILLLSIARTCYDDLGVTRHAQLRLRCLQFSSPA